MREILFRGKWLGNGSWVEGAFCPKNCDSIFGQMVYCPSIIKLDEPDDGYWFDVDPATVGQYTGLKDKNGKRIFEGDILRHCNDNPDSEIEEKGVAFWDEKYCGWRRTSNGEFHHGVVDTYRLSPDCVYEVIGNIHDNPELLKGGVNDG